MRDDQGELLPNAHLIGFFRRICKLLFYNIRPVFVFDGSTPALKRRTVAERRRAREQQETRVRKTAERLLLNRLKQHVLSAGEAHPAAEAKKKSQESNRTANQSQAGLTETLVEEGDNNPETMAIGTTLADAGAGATATEPVQGGGEEALVRTTVSSSDSEDFDYEPLIPEGEEEMDLMVLATLPPSMQLEVMMRLRDRHTAANRGGFEERSGRPEAFSQYQLRQYLRSSNLRRQLEVIRKSNTESGEAARPIAAEEEREYILTTADEEQTDDAITKGIAPAQPIGASGTGTQARAIDVSFVVKEESVVSDDSIEWEDVDEPASTANDDANKLHWRKRAAERQKYWSLSHGFQMGRQLGKWGDKDDGDEGVHVDGARQIGVSKHDDDDTQLQEAIRQSLVESQQNVEQKVREKKLEAQLTIQEEKLMALEESVEVLKEDEVCADTRGISSVPLRLEQKSAAIPNQSANPSVAATTMSFLISEADTSIEIASKQAVEEEERRSLRDDCNTPSDDSKKIELLSLSPSPLTTSQPNGLLKAPSTGTCLPLSSADIKTKNGVGESAVMEPVAASADDILGGGICQSAILPEHIEPSGARRKEYLLRDEEKLKKKTVHFAASPEVAEVLVVGPPSSVGIEGDGGPLSGSLPLLSEPSHARTASDFPVEEDTMIIDQVLDFADQFNVPDVRGEPLDPDVLAREESTLRAERRAAAGQSDTPTDQMYAECQELLQLFGIPYIIAPSEAEAQCAWLDAEGLVDGVVTDDNDAFLFGARRVYRHIFEGAKYVEEYRASDVERELGLGRDRLVALALLLGSDYTPGVKGVGIVNALEVVNAFGDVEGLKRFRDWINSVDEEIVALAKTAAAHGASGRDGATNASVEREASGAETEAEAAFKIEHRGVRKRWNLPSEFPSIEVVEAYVDPKVDNSREKFGFSRPDVDRLRQFCSERFGWDTGRSDELLLPVLKTYDERQAQQTLDNFVAYRQRFAKIRSKRLQKAVSGIAGEGSREELMLLEEKEKNGKGSNKKKKRRATIPASVMEEQPSEDEGPERPKEAQQAPQPTNHSRRRLSSGQQAQKAKQARQQQE